VKKGQRYSCPQPGCHSPNSPWAGIIELFPRRESLVSNIPSGDRNIANLFLQCIISHALTEDNPVIQFQAILAWFRQILSASWNIKTISNRLKGQSREPIFWVECKNLLVIGLVLGTPNIFNFGLVFAEIFIFENQLPGIVYYGESMLCEPFTTQSLQK